MSNLVFLRTFISVYRLNSISKAAMALNQTQPTASGHIQQLERRLGKPLFERLARGIAPTPAAHELARLAAPHLDALEALLDLRLERDSLRGTVLLGASIGLLSSRILPSLSGLPQTGIVLRGRTAALPQLLNELAQGQLDVVVAGQRIEQKGLRFEVLFRSSLVLVAAPIWKKTLGHQPSLALLRQTPLLEYAGVVPISQAYWREVFAEDCPSAQMVFDEITAMLAATVAGTGVAAFPRFLVQDGLLRGELFEVHHPKKPPHNTFYLVTPDGLLHPRVAHVCQLLRQSAQNW
jgi:DNA-binding transcriptional LysR family regulator